MKWRARFALVALTLACVGAAADSARAESSVLQVSGSVSLGRGNPPSWRPLAVGEKLAPGDALRSDRDGRAEILLDGNCVRLYGDSLLRLPTANAARAQAVELERGASLFDITPGRKTPFEVHSPEVIVSVKGTRFRVALEGEHAEVAVYRGEVGVRAPTAALGEVLVRAGFAAIGGTDEPFELFANLGQDPWDAWRGDEPLQSLRERLREASGAHTSAIGAARAAARNEYQPDAIRRVAGENPEFARRLDQLRAERRNAAGAAADLDPEASPAGGRQREALRDGISDSRRDSVIQTLKQNALAGAGSAPGGGLPAPDPNFSVLALDTAVQVDLATNSWTFTALELQQVATGGSLPPLLSQYLASVRNTTDAQFALFALQMLRQPGVN
jgi:hypothetical protein